jgi:DNA topoisomerase-2
VREVPPVKETEAYKTEWRKKWTVVSGEGDTDVDVHVILQKCDVTDPKALGLVKKLSFGNVHLLDARGTLRKYAHPHEIVVAHGEARLALYAKRLAHQVAQLRAEVTAADERARFIEACVEGRFDMRAHETETAAAEEVRALLMIEGDVSHLLKMPLTSLTKHRAAELRKTATSKRAECEALEKVTPKEAWTADLDALRPALP